MDEGILIVNSPHTPDEVRYLLRLNHDIKIFTIDATKIALKTIGRNIYGQRVHEIGIRI